MERTMGSLAWAHRVGPPTCVAATRSQQAVARRAARGLSPWLTPQQRAARPTRHAGAGARAASPQSASYSCDRPTAPRIAVGRHSAPTLSSAATARSRLEASGFNRSESLARCPSITSHSQSTALCERLLAGACGVRGPDTGPCTGLTVERDRRRASLVFPCVLASYLRNNRPPATNTVQIITPQRRGLGRAAPRARCPEAGRWSSCHRHCG